MPNFKASRLAEDIKREMSVIMRDLKDPRIASMLTIVKVDLSNDLSHCKIYISSFEGIEVARQSVKGLESASGFIKRELYAKLKVKKSPDIKFIADDSIEQSAEINKVLRGMDIPSDEVNDEG